MLQPGKIYHCTYSGINFHDPAPLLFVMYANNQYTEGVNLNYLDYGAKKLFLNVILKYNGVFRKIGPAGKILYQMLKMELAPILKRFYRKYTNTYLRGFVVSQGVTYNKINKMFTRQTRDMFIIELNKMLEAENNTNTFANRNQKQINQIYNKIESGLKQTKGFGVDFI